MNQTRKINPLVKILIAATITVIFTVVLIFIIGGRYTTLPDGSKFVGEFETGQPVEGVINNGEDVGHLDFYNKTITYDSGNVYVGDIKDGCRDGYGKMTYADTGDVYVGYFSKGEISGAGVYTYSNGDVFEGNFENGQKNGYGVLKYANGNIYSGTYKDDVRSGDGIFTWASGAKYTGKFENDLKNGFGVMVYENGDVYEGDFKNDMRDGSVCVYSWANGERYNGPFRNNVMDTRITDEDGKFMIDENNEYVHGDMATYTFTTDRTFKGYFENGKAKGITIG